MLMFPVRSAEDPLMPDPVGTRSPEPETVALRARIAALEADYQELVYVASHDLTEPLRMVTSYLGLLERRYATQLDDTAGEFIHYAVDGAARMRALLDDLLRYSRVAGEEPTRRPVDLELVVEQVLRSLEPALADTGATVTVDHPLPTLEADEVKLGQLLQNLIANAAKFRPVDRPNTVRVSAEREATSWRLVVSDDGIGIDPTHAERIFRIFQRLHAREEYAGTGIGLAVCRRIAERMGGTIAVESVPGEGSRFVVSVPDVLAVAP
jgi:light-regulated signal transduction histidine kinase (bacteriophytochrome)